MKGLEETWNQLPEGTKPKKFDKSKFVKAAIISFLIATILVAVSNETSFHLKSELEQNLKNLKDTPLNGVSVLGYAPGDMPTTVPSSSKISIMMENGKYLWDDTPEKEYYPISLITTRYTPSADKEVTDVFVRINGQDYPPSFESIQQALGDDYLDGSRHFMENLAQEHTIYYQDQKNNLSITLEEHPDSVYFELHEWKELEPTDIHSFTSTMDEIYFEQPWVVAVLAPAFIIAPLLEPVLPYTSSIYPFAFFIILLSLLPFVLRTSKIGKRKFFTFLCVLSSLYWLANAAIFIVPLLAP